MVNISRKDLDLTYLQFFIIVYRIQLLVPVGLLLLQVFMLQPILDNRAIHYNLNGTSLLALFWAIILNCSLFIRLPAIFRPCYPHRLRFDWNHQSSDVVLVCLDFQSTNYQSPLNSISAIVAAPIIVNRSIDNKESTELRFLTAKIHFVFDRYKTQAQLMNQQLYHMCVIVSRKIFIVGGCKASNEIPEDAIPFGKMCWSLSLVQTLCTLDNSSDIPMQH